MIITILWVVYGIGFLVTFQVGLETYKHPDLDRLATYLELIITAILWPVIVILYIIAFLTDGCD